LNITYDEHVHDDSKVLPKLVSNIIKSKNITVGKIIADRAYYNSNAVFKCLAVDNGILPCIKVRKNARVNKKTNNIFRNLSQLYFRGKTIYKMERQQRKLWK